MRHHRFYTGSYTVHLDAFGNELEISIFYVSESFQKNIRGSLLL